MTIHGHVLRMAAAKGPKFQRIPAPAVPSFQIELDWDQNPNMSFSDDGKYLGISVGRATAGSGINVAFLKHMGGDEFSLLETFQVNQGALYLGLSFISSTEYLWGGEVSLSGPRRIRFDANDNRVSAGQPQSGGISRSYAVARRQDGVTIASSAVSPHLATFDVPIGETSNFQPLSTVSWPASSYPLNHAVWAPGDGRGYVSSKTFVRLVTVESGDVTVHGSAYGIANQCVNPAVCPISGHVAVCALGDNINRALIYKWDGSNHTLLTTLTSELPGISRCLDYSHDGRYLVVVGDGQSQNNYKDRLLVFERDGDNYELIDSPDYIPAGFNWRREIRAKFSPTGHLCVFAQGNSPEVILYARR